MSDNKDGFNVPYGPFYEDAINSDNYIYKMAIYDVSDGLLPTNYSEDKTIEFQEAVNKRFNIFKKQIQSGETTINELSKFIALKNGPYKKIKLTKEQIMDDIIKGSREPIKDNSNKNIDTLKNILLGLSSKGMPITTADKLFPNVNTGEIKNNITQRDKNKIKRQKKKNNGEQDNKVV
jgi:hypothetical protein